jgi:hypothetical protein
MGRTTTRAAGARTAKRINGLGRRRRESHASQPRERRLPAQARAILSNPVRILAGLCAAGLVLSSAGFGAMYAWQSSRPHGLMLAADAVIFAVASEGAKPLAVAGALRAFGNWRIARGVGLAALAVAAIAFSLTSELALIGTTRGDLAAERAAILAQNQAQQARVEAARLEFATLAPSRPVAEVEADIVTVLADNPKAGDCTRLDGPVSREVCPQIATLRGEIARSQRRAELQATIGRFADRMPMGHAVKAADPASSALSASLALFGVRVATTTLAEWLVLVPVLTLELGAALAAVLMESVVAEPAKRSVGGDRASLASHGQRSAAGTSAGAHGPLSGQPAENAQRHGQSLGHGARTGRTDTKARQLPKSDTVRAQILDALTGAGGRIEAASVRRLASLIAAPKSTVHGALGTLLASGAIVRAGKALALA